MTQDNFKQHIIPLQPAMRRMAMAILCCKEDADDAVQETMIHLWNHRSNLDHVENIESFCIQAVKHKSIDILRRKSTTESLNVRLDAEALVAEATRKENSLYDEIIDLIEQLPQKQQNIMKMKYIEGRKLNEIGDALKMSPMNVGVILSRTYEMLRKKITPLQ